MENQTQQVQSQSEQKRKWYKRLKIWVYITIALFILIVILALIAGRGMPILGDIPNEVTESALSVHGSGVESNVNVKLYVNGNEEVEVKANKEGNFNAELNLTEGENIIYAVAPYKDKLVESSKSKVKYIIKKQEEIEEVKNVELSEEEQRKQEEDEAEATKKTETPNVDTDDLEIVFSANDFNKKSVESLRSKYRESITLDDINELPVVSTLEFKKNNISATSSYPAPEKMIQSVMFIFDDEKCDYKAPISKEETEKLLKTVGVPFNAEKWETQKQGIFERLFAENYEGWGKIEAMCGLSGIRSLSFDSYAQAQEEKEAQAKDAEAQKRTEMIESQFSVWNGSHRNLTKYIKDNMNDPKSYEHVETTYRDMGDYLIITTSFRGKNAFGGTVLSTIRAKVSIEGEVIEILEFE